MGYSPWGLKELRHNLELNNNRKETGALSFSWLCSVLFCEGEVAQLCPTLCDPIDSSPPGFPCMKVKNDGEGNGNPLQYSCLENPMDGEAW